MDKTVIIVAGGTGSRMNSGVPKQFLPLHGKPVLLHSIQTFYQAVADIQIILVMSPEYSGLWNSICKEHNFNISHIFAPGGDTRFQSVKNGLKCTSPHSLIAVHDGARPLVSEKLILNAFQVAEQTGSAIPAIPVNDSLRLINGDSSAPVDRSEYRIIQTPQVFHGNILHQAYQNDFQPEFTDDATVVEKLGIRLTLIPGESGNIKITFPLDLMIAESLISAHFTK